MNNFYKILTQSELIKEHPDILKDTTWEELQMIASASDGTCAVCGQEDIWKYGQSDMCFTCTTGEADASEDYELIPDVFPEKGVENGMF